MALLGTDALLLLVLLAVGLATLLLAVRHRLAFRIAMRNVGRGRARTALLVAGLLVGTTIISGSLVVGDSVQQLSLHYTYLGTGYDDESIYAPGGAATYAPFPYSTYTEVARAVAGNSAIAGVTPMILSTASAFDRATAIPETSLNLIGVNGNQSAALGAFVSDNGSSIAGPAPGEVLIDDQSASALNASAGDPLVIYSSTGLASPFRVQAIVQENVRGAFLTAGLAPGNLFVDLAGAQQLLGIPGSINYIAVTNAGSQSDGASSSWAESAYLNVTVGSSLAPYGLSVHPTLAEDLADASQSANSLVTIFLVLGLFSIVAGAMLIVGIFVMLAEERKGEMGMLRAIGLGRGDLVYSYFFEGAAYSSGSAVAGAFLGVGVGYVLVYLAGFILGGEGIPSGAIMQSFTVSPESLLIAGTAGFLLTLSTVVVAAQRVSRLNIVRAIRSLPEPRPPPRAYTFLAYAGLALAASGAVLFLRTHSGTTDISQPIVGMSLAIVGAGLVASRFLPNRPVFTTVGLALIAWTGFLPLHTALLGTQHTGGIPVLFVEGILMVSGTVLAFLFNADAFVRAIARALGPRAQASPVLRVAFAYPARQPTHTAVSLTIFALVVFTMVATATFGATVQHDLDTTVTSQSGGFSFFGVSQAPIPDLPGAIAQNSTLDPVFASAVPMVRGSVDMNVPGYTHDPYSEMLLAAPPNASGASNFYATNQFPFASTWNGWSPAQTFAAVASGGPYAIVDGHYAPATISFGGGSSAPHPTVSVGEVVRLASPDGGRSVNVTVVGILKETMLGAVWVGPGTASALGDRNATAYFLTVRPGVSTTLAAQLAKVAFFRWDLVLFDIHALLASSTGTTEGFIGLLEIFVGLGLGVGVAAMGILALRAVAERRRDLGILRAEGCTRRQVVETLVVEYSFVTLLGVGMGTALALILVYDATISSSAAANGIPTFWAPWTTVVAIAAVAYALVLAAIAAPALRAARLAPATALRASE